MDQRNGRQVMGKWYVLSLVVLIITIGLNAVPAQAAEQWSQYGLRGTVRDSKAGGFDAPKAVAVDSFGNMYVADSRNHRVQKLDAASGVWSEWGKSGGERGNGLGEFNYPAGVAVDSIGNVYVADNQNHRIQKLTVASGVWSEWGKSGGVAGNGLGEFYYPSAVAVDSTGNVYVSDGLNNRVQKLTEATGIWTAWGKSGGGIGNGLGEFNYPMGVAVDSIGNVYVADLGNHRIQKLTAATDIWTSWAKNGGGAGSGLGEFNYPAGVTVDSNGNVYVGDLYNNRVQKLTAATGVWTSWAKGGANSGNKLGEFNYPSGLAVDSYDNVYVADEDNYRIQKLTLTTGQWNQWGTEGVVSGDALGEFNYPSGVTVDSTGNMYVADSENNRIQRLTTATDVWTAWGKSDGGDGSGLGEFDYPDGIAVDNSGNIYVADADNNRIQKLTAATGIWTSWGKSDGKYGSELGEFDTPKGLAADSDGNLYVADIGNHRIQKLTAATGTWSAWGTNGSGLGEFKYPNGVAVDRDGNVYVADSQNNRIQKLTAATDVWTAWGKSGGGSGNGLGEFNYPEGVAVDNIGNVYVADSYNDRLQKLTAATEVWTAWEKSGGGEGNGLGEFDYPVNVAVDSIGNVYVADPSNNRIQKLVTTSVPGSPTDVTATAADRQATISFVAPVSDGGSAITSYTVTSSPDDSNPNGITATGSVSPITVTGLSNGTTYTFTVVATNIVGDSASSGAISATPQAPIPGAPVLQSPVASNAQVSLSWNPENGSSGYKIFQSVASATYGTEVASVSGSVYSYDVTGLTNGTTYYFVVKAINAGGDSAASNQVSATPMTVPGAPAGITAAAGNGQAMISITAPADNGGSPITGYEVALMPGNILVTGASSPITVTGLSNGVTYTFTVRASNSVGSSVSTDVYSVTPRSSSSSGGGGSSSSGGSGGSSSSSDNTVTAKDGKLTLPAGKKGNVSLHNKVTIVIPANAADKEMRLTIDPVMDIQKLLTNKETLISPIYEILKNFPENFSNPVTLTIAFDAKILNNGQRPSVFYYDETDKAWVEVGGGKINGSTITVEVNHFTKFGVFAVGQTDPTDTKPTISFNDISEHWAEAGINQAVSSGIISGYPDGSFKPNHTVTRAEFAVMLMNTVKPEGEGAALTFTDTGKIGAWAQKAVAQAVQAGIITGYEDNTFRADAEITRAEMAVMVANALSLKAETNGASGFADDKEIAAWAKGAVAAIKRVGLIEGKDFNRFEPNAKTLRAEAVTVLLKVLVQNNN
ncbi:S-layer homology domain-containing protein [Paenibacillus sp. FJAT-26967]|uniref:S-layer homology domain-containing protein n=1 Tax=Paenibacillus sp. FJAT-26967 TaxID=1729690 RepID=UPI000A05330B|nr:S-layer homology domain-containing protein [Paenibacillus sp. FJAT-26967]